MADSKNVPNYSMLSLSMIKELYINQGRSREEISKELSVPVEFIDQVIEANSLEEARLDLVKKGLNKIQRNQVHAAQKAMEIDTAFKQMRLLQLEKQLADFAAYYQIHGDFYKRDPITQEILKDTYGFPIQLHIPAVTKEIIQIKESLNLSEGLKRVAATAKDAINSPKPKKNVGDEVNMRDVNKLFEKRDKE